MFVSVHLNLVGFWGFMRRIPRILHGVSKNRGGPPKWMVCFMENPIEMDDLGAFPYFWVDTHI